MEKEERLKLLLKQVKILTNLGAILLLFAALLLLKQGVFPNAFEFNSKAESGLDLQNEITEYVPLFELDSADIKNGIHLPTGLIVDDGIDLVMTTCVACHSIDLVTQNRADHKGWKDIIVWMQETQGLWDLGENEEMILTYLAKNYAPEDSGRRRNLKNIDWYELQ